MKKLATWAVIGSLAFSTLPAHAGINPKNIDESSSRTNILKVIDEKVEEGKTGGVIGMFAWTVINGEVYSASLAEIRKQARGGDYTKAFSEIIQKDVLENVKIANQQELNDAIVALYTTSGEPSALEVARERIAFLQARGALLEALIDLDHDEHADHIAGLKKAVADAHGEYLQAAADYVAEQVEIGRDENGEAVAASISELTGVTATYDAETNMVSVDTSVLEATKHAEGVASVNLNYDYDGVTYNIVTAGSANTDQLDALRAAAFANGEDNIDITIDMASNSYDIVVDGELDGEQLLLAMHDAVGEAADELTGVSYSIDGGLVFDTGYGSVSDATASITNAGSLTITLNGSTKTVDLSSNSFDAGVDSVDVTVAYDGTDYDIVVDGVSDDDAIDDLMDANFDNGKADIQGKLDSSVTAANVIDGITLTSTGNGQVTLSVDSGNGIISTTAPTGVTITGVHNNDHHFTINPEWEDADRWSVTKHSDGTVTVNGPSGATATGTPSAVKASLETDGWGGANAWTTSNGTLSTTNFTVGLADGYGHVNQGIATAVNAVAGITGISLSANSNGVITLAVTSGYQVIKNFKWTSATVAASDSSSSYDVTYDVSDIGNFDADTYTGDTNLFADYSLINSNLQAEIEGALQEAYNDGYDEGYDDGYNDGYVDGFTDGRAQNS